MRLVRIAPAAVLTIALAWPAFGGFAYCVPVVFNNHPASTLTDFPALFCANGGTGAFCDSVAHTNLALTVLKGTGSGGAMTSASGFDAVWHSDAGCTVTVPFELVAGTYVAATGALEMWVKVASLASGSDTTLYLAVGNAAITTDQSSTSTWETNIKRVYHLPNGSTLTYAESTSQGATGTPTNTPVAAAGQLDGGAAFEASGPDNIRSGDVTGLPTTGNALTISAWVKTSSGSSQFFTSWGTGGISVYIGYGSPANKAYFGDAATLISSTTSVNDGNWHFVAGTYNGSNSRKLYIDGTQESSDANSLTITAPDTYSIGSDVNLNVFACTCSVDESRAESVERTADWILSRYRSEKEPWNFYTIGTPVALATISVRQPITF